MRVYQTDRNGFLLYETAADPDPLSPGEFLIPYGCVTADPPVIGEKQAAKFVDGAWVLVDNYVGVEYWTKDGVHHVIKEMGEKPPKGALFKRPVILAELKDRIILEVRIRLDQVASSWGYDDIKNAVTYAEEPAVPKYQNEGKALRAWRSLLWESAFEELNSVTVNTSVDEFMARLPEPPVRPE